MALSQHITGNPGVLILIPGQPPQHCPPRESSGDSSAQPLRPSPLWTLRVTSLQMRLSQAAGPLLSGAQWQLQSRAGSGWSGSPCPSPAGRLLSSRADLVLPEASSSPPSRALQASPCLRLPSLRATLHCATPFKPGPARGCSQMHLLEGRCRCPRSPLAPRALCFPLQQRLLLDVWCVVHGVRAVCTSHPAWASLWGSRPRMTCPVSHMWLQQVPCLRKKGLRIPVSKAGNPGLGAGAQDHSLLGHEADPRASWS